VIDGVADAKASRGFTRGGCQFSHGGDLDPQRFCAAPLITYGAAKEMNHGHRQDG